MKTGISRTAAFAAATLLAALPGCLNTSRYDGPPPEWAAATKPIAGARIDLSGYYANAGQNRGVKNADGSPFLEELFGPRTVAGSRARGVWMRHPAPDQLQVAFDRGKGPEAEQSISVRTDPSTGAVTLPARDASMAQAQGMMAMTGSTTISLFKGGDGHLYGRFSTSRAGVVMAVIPLGQTEEGWVRWAPASPR